MRRASLPQSMVCSRPRHIPTPRSAALTLLGLLPRRRLPLVHIHGVVWLALDRVLEEGVHAGAAACQAPLEAAATGELEAPATQPQQQRSGAHSLHVGARVGAPEVHVVGEAVLGVEVGHRGRGDGGVEQLRHGCWEGEGGRRGAAGVSRRVSKASGAAGRLKCRDRPVRRSGGSPARSRTAQREARRRSSGRRWRREAEQTTAREPSMRRAQRRGRRESAAAPRRCAIVQTREICACVPPRPTVARTRTLRLAIVSLVKSAGLQTLSTIRFIASERRPCLAHDVCDVMRGRFAKRSAQ